MVAIPSPTADPAARQLYRLAESQAGYFTAAQARALGYDYPHQHYHKTRGHWLEAGWGLYRLRDYPQSDDEELARLSLWSRDRQGTVQATVSHDTALRLYDLSDLMPARVHLTVPMGFRKKAPQGVVLHKVDLEEGDTRRQGSYRITTPLRTLLDLAGSNTSPEHLEQAVKEALMRGLLQRKHLEGGVEGLPLAQRERLEQALSQAG